MSSFSFLNFLSYYQTRKKTLRLSFRLRTFHLEKRCDWIGLFWLGWRLMQPERERVEKKIKMKLCGKIIVFETTMAVYNIDAWYNSPIFISILLLLLLALWLWHFKIKEFYFYFFALDILASSICVSFSLFVWFIFFSFVITSGWNFKRLHIISCV